MDGCSWYAVVEVDHRGVILLCLVYATCIVSYRWSAAELLQDPTVGEVAATAARAFFVTLVKFSVLLLILDYHWQTLLLNRGSLIGLLQVAILAGVSWLLILLWLEMRLIVNDLLLLLLRVIGLVWLIRLIILHCLLLLILLISVLIWLLTEDALLLTWTRLGLTRLAQWKVSLLVVLQSNGHCLHTGRSCIILWAFRSLRFVNTAIAVVTIVRTASAAVLTAFVSV